MKTQLLLISLFSFILCSQPFLRKLEDTVTEASCKAQGKKYQEAVASQCKIADLVLEGKEEKDCKKGEWKEGTGHCTAKEITIEGDCKGIPEFTAGAEKIKTCKLGEEEIKDTTLSASKDACEKKLVWTEGKCTKTEADKTKEECDALSGTWTKTESSSERIRRTEETTDKGSCAYVIEKSETECTGEGESYTKGSCSVTQFDSSAKCQGTPVYYEESKGVCKSGETVLTSRTTEKECKEELKWVTGTCSYEKIYTQKECESDPSYTPATPAKCVADESSNSNFVKAINFALLAICLLIL